MTKRPMHEPAEPVSDSCIKRKQKAVEPVDLPAPTPEELARMHLPGAPFGEPVRWVCVGPPLVAEGPPRFHLGMCMSCSVLARTAYAARAMAAVKMGCAPEEVTVGVVE